MSTKDEDAIGAAMRRALAWWRAADGSARATHKFDLIRSVSTDPISTRAHCAVTSVLLHRVRDDGVARAGAAWLAGQCSLSTNTAARAVIDLERRGLIFVLDRGGTDAGGKQRPKEIVFIDAESVPMPVTMPHRQALEAKAPPEEEPTMDAWGDHPQADGGSHPRIDGGSPVASVGGPTTDAWGDPPRMRGRESVPYRSLPLSTEAARERAEFLKLAPIYARLLQTFGRKQGVEMRIDAEAISQIEGLLAEMCCADGTPAPFDVIEESLWHVKAVAENDRRGWPRTFAGLVASLRRAGWPRIPLPDGMVERLIADGEIARRPEVDDATISQRAM